MMIPSTHPGSAKGYPLIHKIMAHVHKLLKQVVLKATVKVAYFLVCPEGGAQHKWQMPTDWSKSVITNDHRGDVFCISVPVSGMSCPILRPAKSWLDIGFN